MGGPHPSSHPPPRGAIDTEAGGAGLSLRGQRLLDESHRAGWGALELAQQGGKPKLAAHPGRGPDTDHLRAQGVQGGHPPHFHSALQSAQDPDGSNRQVSVRQVTRFIVSRILLLPKKNLQNQ